MTSSINTNGLNVNYPVPGVNNNSQGFRDNFATIKTNFTTAANEITDLQNKVVVKQALDGSTVDNNMQNTLISNALTRSFRASSYNLGNALSGTVTVNVSQGDVQYGTVTANTIIQFGGWAPTGTMSNCQLVLTFANSSAYVQFPEQCINAPAYGLPTLENYVDLGNVGAITIPYNSNIASLQFSTLDCGNAIYVQPVNRPRKSTQLDTRTPPSTGFIGDVTGTIATDSTLVAAPTYVTAANTTYDFLTCGNTAGFYLDMPVIFTGNVFGGVTAGEIYYVHSIANTTAFKISSTPGTVSGPASTFNLSTANGNMTVSPVTYLYVATRDYDANSVVKTSGVTTEETYSDIATATTSSGNLIQISNTNSLVQGYPVTFSGTPATTYATVTGANAAFIAGNVAVMNSSTIAGTTLTVGSVAAGTIEANMILSGTGVAANTYIVSGAGLSWTISPSQTVASTTITGVTGIVGTTLTVGSLTSGTISSGMWVNAPNVANGTYITGGAGSTWTVNNSQTVGLNTANLSTSKITVADTSLFTVGNPVTVSGITLGGLTGGNYFVAAIPDAGSPGNITLANTFAGSNVQTAYDTGNMTITYGGLFGNLQSGTTYYVNNVEPTINAGSFVSGLNYEILSLGTTSWGAIGANTSATSTTSSNVSTSLTVGGTITGSFAAGQQITGTNIVAGTKIVSQTSGTPGAAGVYLIDTAPSGAVSGAINAYANGTVFTASGAGSGTGTAIGYAQFSISTVPFGANVALTSGTRPGTGSGTCNVTATTDYTISVNNTNNLEVNSPVVFVGSVIGGIAPNTVYYINSIDSGNAKITISQTRHLGIAGQKVELTSESSNNAMGVISFNGTSIFKRLPLDSF